MKKKAQISGSENRSDRDVIKRRYKGEPQCFFRKQVKKCFQETPEEQVKRKELPERT